jgi:hypothetical protein
MQEFRSSYPPFNVKETDGKGRGAFSSRSLAKGEIIAFYTGKVFPLSRAIHLQYDYVFSLIDGPGSAFEFVVVCSDNIPSGGAYYINHTSNRAEQNTLSVIGFF